MFALRNWLPLLSCLGAVTVQAHATPAPIRPSLYVLEDIGTVPQGWIQGNAPPPKTRLRFRLALQQESVAFEQHVISISTPHHPNYGKHMTREEVKRMNRPSPQASESVMKWLHGQAVLPADIEDDGDWINFNTTLDKAEQMLNTTFKYYSNHFSQKIFIRTLKYSVPENLKQYVHMIQPTTRFGGTAKQHLQPGHRKKRPAGLYSRGIVEAPDCNQTVTPQCLKDLYRLGSLEGSATNGGRMGVCRYLEDYAQYADFDAFVTKYVPGAATDNFTYVSINGGLATQGNLGPAVQTAEGNLDAEYAFSLSSPTPGYYYSTGGIGELVPDLEEPVVNENEPYLDFLHYILSLPDEQLPTTLSSSYGEDEQSVPRPYVISTCNLFAQLGARGVSVIFSSGDAGPGRACQSNDGTNSTRFTPQFPAACPFVTSVGGTQYIEPEEAWPFSSGGFSDVFARPAYQDDAVSAYLGFLGDKWKGLYNPSGRGFPDVAAQAVNYTILDNGIEHPISGTSAATPTFAAIISLLNSHRLSNGQPPLGFLNPFLYSLGSIGLSDIVKGSSVGCTGFDAHSGLTGPVVKGAGWEATTGWDPVTGLGTPDLEALLLAAEVWDLLEEGR